MSKEKEIKPNYNQCSFGVKVTGETERKMLAHCIKRWDESSSDETRLELANQMMDKTLALTPGDEVFVYPDGKIKSFVDIVVEEGGVAWLKEWCTKKPPAGENDMFIICRRSEAMVTFACLRKNMFGIYVIEKYIEINPSKSVVKPEFVFNGVNIADRKRLYAKEMREEEDGDGQS